MLKSVYFPYVRRLLGQNVELLLKDIFDKCKIYNRERYTKRANACAKNKLRVRYSSIYR